MMSVSYMLLTHICYILIYATYPKKGLMYATDQHVESVTMIHVEGCIDVNI